MCIFKCFAFEGTPDLVNRPILFFFLKKLVYLWIKHLKECWNSNRYGSDGFKKIFMNQSFTKMFIVSVLWILFIEIGSWLVPETGFRIKQDDFLSSLCDGSKNQHRQNSCPIERIFFMSILHSFGGNSKQTDQIRN